MDKWEKDNTADDIQAHNYKCISYFYIVSGNLKFLTDFSFLNTSKKKIQYKVFLSKIKLRSYTAQIQGLVKLDLRATVSSVPSLWF